MLDQDTEVSGYCLEELLGRGGMGAVFRARHVESGRVVALKVIADRPGSDAGLAARFRGEGRAQAALENPHVVTVYDAGESDSGLYLAMQLVEGPSLAELIRDRELGASRALDVLDQVAEALDAAHAAGLVHRDVKPHNVLVGPDDHAYLSDFGLTRVAAETALTAPGALVGTVAYLAPEVVRGEDATSASDLYAFAAVAFECLTGSIVFPRSSDAAVLFAHVNEPPPRIGARRPELGSELDELFERALAKDPSERPASARDLVAAIRDALERAGAAELAPPQPTGAVALGGDASTDPGTPRPKLAPAPRPGGRRRRTAGLVALAALGGAVVVAGAWAAFGSADDGSPAIAPADRAGLTYVGADLNGSPGRALDCRGRPPGPASPACTNVQTALPGATVVVPRDGVIRQWSVRGAKGELTLLVARPREGGALQIANSATETVGSADVQSFDTDLEVERGDLVGVHLTPGSAVGVRTGVRGATVDRWLPPLTGVGRPPENGGIAGTEVLLRVGIVPGGRQHQPGQVTGSAAERLPAGHVLNRRTERLQGKRIDLALVRVGPGFALDELVGGRRVARMQVPDMRSGAQVVLFFSALWSPEQAGLDLSFVNEASGRVVQHSYAVNADGYVLIR